MTTRMAVYAALVGALLAVAAVALESAAAALRLPRRWAWTAALVSTLALTLWLPWRAPQARLDAVAGTSVAGPLGPLATGLGRWWSTAIAPRRGAGPGDAIEDVAFVVWAAAAGLFIVVDATGIALLRRRRANWPATTVGRRRVFLSDDLGPAVVGFWSTSIVVPRWALQLPPRHLELLLCHEAAHQAAHDSILIHVGELALAAMPWNPAVWWMRAHLRAAIELDCDARVLAAVPASAGRPRSDLETYGDLLLTVASHPRSGSLRLTSALIERASTLKRRILAMSPTPRRPLRSRLVACGVIAAALVAAALMFPVPSLHAQYDRARGAYRAGTPGLANPVVLREVKPGYPPGAQRAKIQGTVVIEGVVTVAGQMEDLRITKSLDKKYGLDDEAVRVAKLWVFRPGALAGKPVPVIVTLELRFTLRD
jgi:bla regulator protein blaR1